MRSYLFVIVALSFSAAFALDTNSLSYSKGDDLVINASGLSAGGNYSIQGLLGKDLVFSHEFTASGSDYSYVYKTGFLDPSGEWSIVIKGPGVDQVKVVNVASILNSSYYLVSFITPVSRGYERTSFFNVTVNLTIAGEVVTGALVQSFSDSGVRFNLSETEEPGIYSGGYALSLDSVLGVRNITVVASRAGFGGEGVTDITVNPARLVIDLIQPELDSYDVGSLVYVRLSAFYSNGSIMNGDVYAFFNNNSVMLNLTDSYYTGSYLLKSSDAGLVSLRVSVSDFYGNTGFVSKEFTGAGLLKYYVLINIYYVIAGVLLGVFVLVLSRRKVVNALDSRSLRNREEELIVKKKKIQEDYFVNASLSKDAYENGISKIEEELNLIKDKLSTIGSSKIKGKSKGNKRV